VQEFLGLLETPVGVYAVLENLEAANDVFSIKDVLARDDFVSTTILTKKLRLCYEIVNTVAYMHSVNLVVKVITDEFVFVRFKDNQLWPIFTNLECARNVLVPLGWLTIVYLSHRRHLL